MLYACDFGNKLGHKFSCLVEGSNSDVAYEFHLSPIMINSDSSGVIKMYFICIYVKHRVLFFLIKFYDINFVNAETIC